jgi:hypothetical protein
MTMTTTMMMTQAQWRIVFKVWQQQEGKKKAV